MKYTIKFLPRAIVDRQKLEKSGDKIALKKLMRLLDELEIHPRTGTGKPEQLKNDKSGAWSRRITDKHRLVYIINDTTVIVLVLASYGHYRDK